MELVAFKLETRSIWVYSVSVTKGWNFWRSNLQQKNIKGWIAIYHIDKRLKLHVGLNKYILERGKKSSKNFFRNKESLQVISSSISLSFSSTTGDNDNFFFLYKLFCVDVISWILQKTRLAWSAIVNALQNNQALGTRIIYGHDLVDNFSRFRMSLVCNYKF